MPPAAIAPTWPQADGTSSTTTAASTASVARGRSGQSDFAMPHTACATTATAAIFSPCSQPEPSALSSVPTP